MSPSEHTTNEAKRSVYDTCDPHYLRQLREAAGMDLLVLARTACLSVAQVRQLETDDSDGLFYSDAIKRQAYKRLLMILGAEPPTVEVPEDLRDPNKVADAHLNTLDQIVAMSHQPAMNRTSADIVGMGITKLKQSKQVVSALLLLLVAVGLFVMYGPQSSGDLLPLVSVSSEASKKPDTPVSVEPSPPAVLAASAASTIAAPSSIASTPVVAPVVPAPVAVVTASVPNTNASCAHSDDAMPQLTPFVAQKEGRYVYLVSPKNADVCVVDGNKQATLLQMKAGENRSVYGVAPWQVSSANLSSLQIYFQGGRVTLPDAATRVKLVEVPVQR